ncbi:MAG: Co2+/Mg2+ efflux protein ApaG [Planctomycetota bacterium]
MEQLLHSDTVTEGIRVQAAAQYLPDESDPQADRFVYVYRIVIRNEGNRRAKLLTRHWIIRDADGHREDVKGPGVVGQFPDLAPGETFHYVSGCPLRTRWGTMEGTYTMERDDGDRFPAEIGRFFLAPTAPALERLV